MLLTISSMVYYMNLSYGGCRHENVQFLEKLKQLVLFIERKLEKKVLPLITMQVASDTKCL
jgi:hypothetical protein